MSGIAGEKLNSGFIMRSYELFQRKNGRVPTGTETILEGFFRSYANAKRDCKFGYAQICQRLGVSRSTCTRKIKLLKDEGRINVERKGTEGSLYTYELEVDPKEPHVRSEDCFFTDTFKMVHEDGREEERRLKISEVDVLSWIYSLTWDGKKPCEASYEEMGKILGYASETIARAVKNLKDASLITHKVKGANQHKKNKFFVKMGTLRAHGITRSERKKEEKKRKAKERAELKAQKQAEEQARIDAANAKAERERFYDLRRQEAKSNAEKTVKNIKRAEPRFGKIEVELAKLEIEVAKAEIGDPSKLPSIQSRRANLKEERRLILEKLGVSEEELRPRWKCSKCSDKGFLPNGLGCTCYDPKELP